MNLHYDPVTKRVICDPDPEAEMYECCVAQADSENWDCEQTPHIYRSVANKKGNMKSRAREKKIGKWGVYSDIIYFTVT